MAACASQPPAPESPPQGTARDHLEFYAAAVNAAPAARDAMWKSLDEHPEGEGRALRRALLRSIPGHAAHDPASASAALEDLIAQAPSAEVAAVARARLLELRSADACREEVAALKQRLMDVVNIERDLGRNGTSP